MVELFLGIVNADMARVSRVLYMLITPSDGVQPKNLFKIVLKGGSRDQFAVDNKIQSIS